MSEEDNTDVDFSHTVFSKNIREGKSTEVAEAAAIAVGKERKNSLEGRFKRWLKLKWLSLVKYIGGFITTALATISVLGTEKINNVLQNLIGN